MSFMSNKAILKEGIIDSIVKKLFLNKKLKKDKGFQKQVNKLNEYFLKDKEFDKFLLAATQSIDGFHSFYTYEEAKNNRKEILSTYVLEFIADKFYEEFEPIEFEIHLKDD